jgi:hypothetical protein
MIIYNAVVVVVVVGAIVVVVVVVQPPAITHVSLSNSFDIVHRRLLCVLQPICLDGIAIILFIKVQ